MLSGCNNAETLPVVDAYVASIEQWHQERIESLKANDGWLSLAGLFWLQDGENSFGSHASNDLIFPAGKAPEFIGAFFLENGHVRVSIKPGLRVLHEGAAVQEMALQSDADGEPTILQWQSLSWNIIKRGESEFAVRLRDSDHPPLQTFTGTAMFPIDPTWRIEARFEPYAQPETLAVATVYGGIQQHVSPGLLTFRIHDMPYSVVGMASPEDDQFFVMFADATNGEQTYAIGRYLYVDRPGADGATIIDFNTAYNPPCAFTDFATCPLPPARNRLSVRITAGEKKYTEGLH